MSRFFRHERQDGDIEVLSFDAPEERVNTLQAELIPEFAAWLEAMHRQPPAGIIITSSKADCFIAGADIRMLDLCPDAEAARALAQQGQQLFARLAALPCPVVAAIHGSCLGGGLELALACDARVASQAASTRLGLPEIQLGLLPGSGGTQRLPRLVGLPQALEMMLTGRQLTARQAWRCHLVDDVVPQEQLLLAARQQLSRGKRGRARRISRVQAVWSLPPLRSLLLYLARTRAERKARGHYPAIAGLLQAISTGLSQGMVAGLACEAEIFGQLVCSPQSAALRHLFFATREQKRTGEEGAAPAPVTTLGVLGAGLMGAGIAAVSVLQAGCWVRIKETGYPALQKAMAHLRQQLSRRGQRGALTPREQEQRLARCSGTLDYAGFRQLDLVIEAVFEDLALKQRMVNEVQQVTGPAPIFASNTSSLPIHQIAAGALYPQRVLGLHYFSPVEKMPLVEVIPHATTDPQAVATVLALARAQGKTPIVVKDVAGFFVNRILAPYMLEAVTLLSEGEAIEEIDKALLSVGFPVGPLALLDEVGLDVVAHIGPVLAAAHGERFALSPLLAQLLARGSKGRKSGRGFYRYPASGKKQVDTSLYDVLKILPIRLMSLAQMAERCQLLMLNEAVRCLDEGVIASAADGDVAAVYGIGYPPFTGGPFWHLQQIGLAEVVNRLHSLEAAHGPRFAPCDGLRQRLAEGRAFY